MDNKRALHPWQKRQVIEDLFSFWVDHPELRFGQLIVNYQGNMDLYYIEDFDIIDELKRQYAKRF
jgi:hypothetical protein